MITIAWGGIGKIAAVSFGVKDKSSVTADHARDEDLTVYRSGGVMTSNGSLSLLTSPFTREAWR